MVVNAPVKFTNEYKGKLFKEAVETYVNDETEDAYDQWLSLAHEKISNYLPDIQLSREEAAALQQSNTVTKGDESEEDPSPTPKKENEMVMETERTLRESAVERAKRIDCTQSGFGKQQRQ